MPETKTIKLSVDEWKAAKLASVIHDMRLMDWIAEAIKEKIAREKEGKA